MAALPEILFQDAGPETKAIYRKLMDAAGSGSPALIFRHLAIFPGLLDWVWQAVGPEVETGWPRQMIWALRDGTAPVPIGDITQETLTGAGIDARARETVGHMLTSYNRMNPINLVMIGGTRMLLDPNFQMAEQVNTPAAVPPPPEALPDLPPPPPVADLPADLQDLIRGICRTIPDIGAETTPTMYRHFAIWPDFMRAVGERLDAHMDELHQATLDFGRAAEPLAQTMAARAGNAGPLPDVEDREALLKTLDGFLYVIPHMIVVGKAIEAALPK